MIQETVSTPSTLVFGLPTGGLDIFPQCTDTPNFIFAIKQGGLGLTLEEYNSLLAQLA